MAEHMIAAVEKRLRNGFKVVSIGADEYVVQNAGGEFLRDEGHVIRFRDASSTMGHFYDNLIAALRRAGAIKEYPERRHHTPRERRVSHKAPKNAVIIAQETLRDTKATPRERALARNFLVLMENHNNVRKLAQKLGARLREIEKELD